MYCYWRQWMVAGLTRDALHYEKCAGRLGTEQSLQSLPQYYDTSIQIG